MHWSKFTDCIASMRDAETRAHELGYFGKLADAMESSQRFYFPTSNNFLEGVEYDDGVQALIRLPYDVISVLSDTFIHEPDGSIAIGNTWKITTAFNAHGETNARLRLGGSQEIPSDNIIIATSVLADGVWHSAPHICVMAPITGGGFSLDMVQDQKWILNLAMRWTDAGLHHHIKDNMFKTLTADMVGDMSTVINLCAILNLKGTERVATPVPPKLAAKRAKTGKDPLYDYHVVKIGGEVWDSPYSPSSNGGVRSHLRRGHIRRIGAGNMTWVRAAMVRGSRPGFVDKDYTA